MNSPKPVRGIVIASMVGAALGVAGYALIIGGLRRAFPTPVGLPEQEAPAPADVTFAVGVVHKRATGSPPVPVAALPPVPPSGPLAAFLLENPDSPLALLEPDEAAKWLPTRENLIGWYESMSPAPPVAFLNLPDVDYNEDLAHLWKLCREHQALRSFCIGYQDRELDRWAAGLPSVPLEEELRPTLGFMQEQYGFDEELWSLINAYSVEAVQQIRGEGERAARQTDSESKWELHEALCEASWPSSDAVFVILRGK